MALVSSRIRRADQAFARVRHFYFASRYADRRTSPEISDFTFGNPHEMPLEGLVSALRNRAIPENKDWFAYKTSDDDACEIVAEASAKNWALLSIQPTSP
jgi:aspartate aminotransferase